MTEEIKKEKATDWTQNLTETQTNIMKALGGLLTDISYLMEAMCQGMDKSQARVCQIGYVNALAKTLGIGTEDEQN